MTQPINDSVLVEKAPKDLKPWPGNARRHPRRQLEALKSAIQRFGFTCPVLVDEQDRTLAGHGRVTAAIELGLPTIPTRTILGLSEPQKRAYVITDNKIGLLSDWDEDLLRIELQTLVTEDFEVELTGFSTAELDIILDTEPKSKVDPDDLTSKDLNVPAVTRKGDLWILGEHRLLCGDALDANSYSILLEDQKVQMVFTDPPYNVKVDGHVCGTGAIKHREFAMASGEMSPTEFTEFLERTFSLTAATLTDGAIVYACMDWRHMREITDAAQPVFGDPKQLCIWAKDNAGLGTFYRSQHELVFIFKHGKAAHINNFELGQSGRFRTNIWRYPNVTAFKGSEKGLLAVHPTVKPTSMVADAIRDCSHRRGLVLDPFAGSGTVLVAAQRTDRYARAIEFDPLYVDVAINRWQRVTGLSARLVGTDKTWEEVRLEREPARGDL